MHIPYHYIPTLRTYSQLCPFDAKAEQVNPRRNRFTGARIFGGITFLSPMTAVVARVRLI